MRDLEDKQGYALALGSLAEFHRRSQDPTRAKELANEARQLFREMGDHRGEAAMLELCAAVEVAEGWRAEAARLLEEADTLRAETGTAPTLLESRIRAEALTAIERN